MRINAKHLDGETGAYILIKPDRDRPGHAYFNAPRYCSLPPAEMIRLANCLADMLESGQEAV